MAVCHQQWVGVEADTDKYLAPANGGCLGIFSPSLMILTVSVGFSL